MDKSKTNVRICPVCNSPVGPERGGVYRVADTDYHPECYEEQPKEPGGRACESDEPDDGR